MIQSLNSETAHMLEKPAINDEIILVRLEEEYGLHVAELVFLPLGADMNTAVYRAEAEDHTSWFVKLRSGGFDEIAVTVPALLRAQGIEQVIAPMKTSAGRLWARMCDYHLIVYPFVEGLDGYNAGLTAQQWVQFGAAVRRIHSASLPAELRQRIPVESFTDRYREQVRQFQTMVENTAYDDPAAAKMAGLMRERRKQISDLNERAARLAGELQSRPMELVLCHTDLHAGNLHITPSGAFYIVDWDNPILAPKERDLMYVGGGLSGRSYRVDEEALFYQGYGIAAVDRAALAYYRIERIIQDFAAFGEQLLLSDEGGSDREQGYQWFASNFLPGGLIELTLRSAEQ